jgi:hypothetical protein
LFDCGFEGAEDFLVRFVVIYIDDYIGNCRDQPPQHFALHWGEIKKAIQHQQVYILEPGQA